MKQTVNWEWSNPFFWTTAIGGKEVETSLWGGTFSLKKQSLMMNPPFQWARQAAKKHHTAFCNTFLTHLQPNAWVMRYFSCHSCQCFSALVCCGIPPVYPTEIIRRMGWNPRIWVLPCLEINIHLQVFPSSSWGSLALFWLFSRIYYPFKPSFLAEWINLCSLRRWSHLSWRFHPWHRPRAPMKPHSIQKNITAPGQTWKKNLEKGLLHKNQHCFMLWRIMCLKSEELYCLNVLEYLSLFTSRW